MDKALMPKTWIKICGTTNLEDALASVEAGADALGFIFAESPRRVSAEKARAIIAKLPPHIEKIGIFVDSTAETIRETAALAGLSAVQLHGDESAGFSADLWGHRSEHNHDWNGLKILKAIHVPLGIKLDDDTEKSFELLCTAATFEGVADLLLFDSQLGQHRGGTGKVFDWQHLKEVIGSPVSPFVIAGGLTPENVGRAIAALHPFGVDVVSGVEKEKGKKDHAKLRAFVEAVRAADLSG